MFKSTLLFICLSLSLTACLPSFVPLSKKNEATPEGLTGTWFNKNAEYLVSLKEDHYEIEGKVIDQEIKAQTPYIMTVSKIGADLYATVIFNIRKAESSWSKEMKNQLELNVAPQAWIFRLQLEGDTLKLLIWDPQQAALPAGYDSDEPSPIMADRKVLREWIAANGDKAFKEDEGFVYKRRAAEMK